MWNRIQHVAIFSAVLMPIDVSPFHSGIAHWRNIRDDSRFIQPEQDQPSYSVEQVGEIIDNILLFQRTNGGWPKDYDVMAVLTDSQRSIVEQTRHNEDTSYDNGNIHSQVEYLAQAYSQEAHSTWREACERGFDFMIRSQYSNGGFPQRFPNPKSFHAHITFNDGVMVRDAVAWLREVSLRGIRVNKVKSTKETFLRHTTDLDVVVVDDPNAPVLWARHYEIGTNRPIFSGRDGIKKYALAEIERERRTGSAWYGGWPQGLVDQEYAKWCSRFNISEQP